MSTREFDDIIKQKAQRRQADVPPDIWDSIANRKQKRRRPFFWLIFLMLLIGSSVAFWKMKNTNNDVATVVTEKATVDKKKDGNQKEKTAVSVENKNQSSVSKKIKSGEANADVKNKTAQTIDNLNTNNNTAAQKRKPFLPLSKEQSTTNIVLTNKKEKTFLQSQYKRNTKGKYKATIQNGESGELDDSGNTKNVIDANETQQEQLQKNSIADSLAANNNIVDIPIAATVDNNKTNEPVKIIADSLSIQKIAQPDKAIVAKEETTTAKKAITKQKSTGLKIEARTTIVFPVQQYEQPQTVQRILHTSDAAVSFVSDKSITSTIESGNGISISLVKKLNNKWSIGAGISYLRFTERLQLQGNETNTEYRVVQRLREGPNGAYLKPDTLGYASTYSTTLSGRNIYHNAGIPLFARYRVIAGKKLSCELTTGFTVNLLRKYVNNIPGEFTTVYADGSKQSSMKNSIGMDVFAGLIFSGRLYRKYEWFAASEYVYNLSAYTTSSLSFTKKIHLPGISFGVLYEIKK